MGLGVLQTRVRSIPGQTAATAPAPPFAAVLAGLPGAEGRGGVQKILCRAGWGRIGGSEVRGGRGGCRISRRPGGGSDSTAPLPPAPGARPPFPSSRRAPGTRLFPRSGASAPSGSPRPFPSCHREASRRELRPLSSASARPRPSRRAPALPPRSCPPAAGTRVAAYKRGETRASPPLPAAERTARREVAEARRFPQQPPSRRTHRFHPAGAGERGSWGEGAGPEGRRPLGGEPGSPWGGAGARTGEPRRPRSCLRRAGTWQAGRDRPGGAWAGEEPPGPAWAPAAGMSLTGRRWRGEARPAGRSPLPHLQAWLRPRPAPSGCGRWGGGPWRDPHHPPSCGALPQRPRSPASAGSDFCSSSSPVPTAVPPQPLREEEPRA